MPLSKKQLQRLIRLVVQLNENRYPNCSSFAAAMRKADLEENLNLSCTPKTIFRDIQTLKNDFGAPIRFDSIKNGYYLTRDDWVFSAPQIYEDPEMLAAVIGARVSEHIFPSPMREQVRSSVDQLLAHHNPDFLSRTQIDSLIVIPANKTDIKPEIFMPLFKAWQERRRCRIEYEDSRGQTSGREFEPHALVFFEGIWYAKGYCHKRMESRSLVLARMRTVEVLQQTFIQQKAIVESANEDEIFGSDTLIEAVVLCDPTLAKIVPARPLHPEQQIIMLESGECELHISAIPRYRLITWIMHQCGRASILSPASLQGEIITFAEQIILHQKAVIDGRRFDSSIETESFNHLDFSKNLRKD